RYPSGARSATSVGSARSTRPEKTERTDMDLGSWSTLGWQAWVTLGVIVGIFAVLMAKDVDTDVVLTGGITILLVTGVLSAKDALAGLSNEGIVTIAVLY